MSKAGKKSVRRSKPEEDEDEDPIGLLLDIREILLNMLLMQACPLCFGHGRFADGEEAGKPRVVICACRHRAVDFLSEFEGAGPTAPPKSRDSPSRAERSR